MNLDERRKRLRHLPAKPRVRPTALRLRQRQHVMDQLINRTSDIFKSPAASFGACRLVNGRQPVHARPNRTFPRSEPATPGDSSGSPA
jgi:hypothetical protein